MGLADSLITYYLKSHLLMERERGPGRLPRTKGTCRGLHANGPGSGLASAFLMPRMRRGRRGCGAGGLEGGGRKKTVPGR